MSLYLLKVAQNLLQVAQKSEDGQLDWDWQTCVQVNFESISRL
jgi:hypothetical protein